MNDKLRFLLGYLGAVAAYAAVIFLIECVVRLVRVLL